jgi:hypothetical protein
MLDDKYDKIWNSNRATSLSMLMNLHQKFNATRWECSNPSMTLHAQSTYQAHENPIARYKNIQEHPSHASHEPSHLTLLAEPQMLGLFFTPPPLLTNRNQCMHHRNLLNHPFPTRRITNILPSAFLTHHSSCSL